MFSFTNNRLAVGVDGICLPSSKPPKHEKQVRWGLIEFVFTSYEAMEVCNNLSLQASLQMAAAASNKTTSKKDTRYPEIEEDALQFMLDACEASISKYSKFLQVSA